MFDSDVDAFLDVAVANALVDNDADRVLCNVVDDSSLAVIHFEGHAVYIESLAAGLRNRVECGRSSGSCMFGSLLL